MSVVVDSVRIIRTNDVHVLDVYVKITLPWQHPSLGLTLVWGRNIDRRCRTQTTDVSTRNRGRIGVANNNENQ